MEPFEADALLLNCDEFHDTESEPLSKCPTGLTREEIVSAALADASRGTACTIIVLETDLNNSIRLNYARTKLEFNKKQMDQLAQDMAIGQSKRYELWKVASHPGYIARIRKNVTIDRIAHATLGVEFRAKGWMSYLTGAWSRMDLSGWLKPGLQRKSPTRWPTRPVPVPTKPSQNSQPR